MITIDDLWVKSTNPKLQDDADDKAAVGSTQKPAESPVQSFRNRQHFAVRKRPTLGGVPKAAH